jgi:acyl carrier protein
LSQAVDQNLVLRKIAETLQVDAEVIGLQTSAEDVDAWDSVGTMSLILMLSREFGVNLAPNRTSKLQSVEGILELMRTQEKDASP